MKILNDIKIWLTRHWSLLVLFFAIAIIVFLASRDPEVIIQTKDSPSLLAELKREKDKNGNLIGILQQRTISENHARVEADSLKKALGLKPNQIKGVDVIVTETDTLFYPKAIYVDSGTSKPYYKTKYEDSWLKIDAVAGRDTSSIQFKQYDTITRVEVVKNPLIGRTKRTITIINKNPHSVISKGYSWTVKEPQTYLTIGPYVGYDLLTRKPSIGISAQIPIIKLKRK